MHDEFPDGVPGIPPTVRARMVSQAEPALGLRPWSREGISSWARYPFTDDDTGREFPISVA